MASASLATLNSEMKMSPKAKAHMKLTEKMEYRYYNDMGKLGGNCTWGAGIMVHKGPCTLAELRTLVTAADIERAFARKVDEAERAVTRNITAVQLNQAQFDALVSLTYNAGATGAKDTYALVNRGDFAGAAANICAMTLVTIKTKTGKKKVRAKGLIRRRAEESAPFRVSNNKE